MTICAGIADSPCLCDYVLQCATFTDAATSIYFWQITSIQVSVDGNVGATNS